MANLAAPVVVTENIIRSWKRIAKSLDVDEATEKIAKFQEQLEKCLEDTVEGTFVGDYLLNNLGEELVYKLWDIYNG